MAHDPFYVDESRPWFSREAGWPDEVPKNIVLERRPLGEVLRESARKFADLPKAARDYVMEMERLLGAPARIVSVGPEREELIMRQE